MAEAGYARDNGVDGGVAEGVMRECVGETEKVWTWYTCWN